MQKINFVVFPYRSLWFKKTYGNSVRDLQIIELLKAHKNVDRVLVVERPVAIYEVLLGRYLKEKNHLVKISLDPFGPFKKRLWTEHCYTGVIKEINQITKNWENIVVLDFTPIAKLDLNLMRHDYYWYDLIDNFTIHNRYSLAQKRKVSEKYDLVSRSHDMITGVSGKAISSFSSNNKHVFPNGLYLENGLVSQKPCTGRDKYGFVGFVTNKLDLEFIKNLLQKDVGSTVGMYGDILDDSVREELKKLDRVKLYGRFHRKDYASIFRSFDVGLIPYLPDKSHDGSALKLYDYLVHGKPVITSMDYELKNKYIFNYSEVEIDKIIIQVNSIAQDADGVDAVSKSIPSQFFLHERLNKVLNLLVNEVARNGRSDRA